MKCALFAAVTSALLLGTTLAEAADTMSGMDMGKHDARQAASFGEPGKSASITRTVNIAATEMSYNPNKLAARVGDTIKFVVTNKGSKDHEFVIGDQASQKQHQEEMASMPGMDMSGPNGFTLKPGETKSLVWHFTKAGDFSLACDLPGHADAGMKGDIIIK